MKNPQKQSQCEVWYGCLNSNGYGVISFNKRQYYVHRLSYLIHRGEIPKNLVIDHLCRNRACINPNHLELVTNGENVLRGESFSAKNSKKTQCKNGHPFTKENTYSFKSGEKRNPRICKICWNKKRMEQYRKSKLKLSSPLNI